MIIRNFILPSLARHKLYNSLTIASNSKLLLPNFHNHRLLHRKFISHLIPMRQGETKLTIKSCRDLPAARFPEYIKSSHNRLYNIVWSENPLSNVFLVKKPWEPTVRDAMVELINHLHVQYPCINVIVDENVADEMMNEVSSVDKQLDSSVKHIVYTGSTKEIISKTDLIITLGGDGTILRGVSLFSNVQVPPVLSFAMGTLGFLLPFDFKSCMLCFALVYENRAQALHRNRLECHVVRNADVKTCEKAEKEEEEVAIVRNKKRLYVEIGDTDSKQQDDQVISVEKQEMIHAMNDITIHRGSSPNLTSLDIYIDNEFFTTTYADGLIFSTPTGSTAYSLSAGGSITHPAVACILLTPICPRSLSFRPLILPCTSVIMVRLSENNRSSFIELTVDGISQQDLHPGDELHITSETVVVANDKIKKQKRNNGDSATISNGDNGLEYNDKNGIWCVATNQNQWSKDLNSLLGFNSSFRGQKSKKLHL